jgi:UPF0271 protein
MKCEIDINADLGESEFSLAKGSDFELMRHITSANIACGGHAGDVRTMGETLAAAKRLGVAVGAHPSYPDRANFGRVELALEPREVEAAVRGQVAALGELARRQGMKLAHVKPHGALYHAANRNRELALAVGSAVQSIDPGLILIGQAGSPVLDVWRGMGLAAAAEAFADRAYEPDGALRKRTLPGALLDTPERAAAQALEIALRQRVVRGDGAELKVVADTLCIHSDTPGAAAIARMVRERLETAGVRVRQLASRERRD